MSYTNVPVNISENQQQKLKRAVDTLWAFVSATKICVEVMFLLWPIHKWTEWQKLIRMEKASQQKWVNVRMFTIWKQRVGSFRF